MKILKFNVIAIFLLLLLANLGCQEARISSRAYATAPGTLKNFTRYTIIQDPKITSAFLDKYYKADIKAYVSRNQDRIEETTEDMLGPIELQPLQKQFVQDTIASLTAKGLIYTPQNPQFIIYIDFSQGVFAYTVPSKRTTTETSESVHEVGGRSTRTTRYQRDYIGEHTNLSYGLSFCAIVIEPNSSNILWQSSVTGISQEDHFKKLRKHLLHKLFSPFPNASPRTYQSIKIKNL